MGIQLVDASAKYQNFLVLGISFSTEKHASVNATKESAALMGENGMFQLANVNVRDKIAHPVKAGTLESANAPVIIGSLVLMVSSGRNLPAPASVGKNPVVLLTELENDCSSN